MTTDYKNLRMLDAIYQVVADAEAEDPRITREVRRDSDAIMAFVQGRLAEMRRAELRRKVGEASLVKVSTARPSILAMSRDAVLARLASLWTAHPGVIVAHRNFAGMTDDDLRAALEDAESLVERME